MYGIPHGWGANLLMWRTDKVTPGADSWSAVFDARSPYKGKVTAYDSPIYIADAALYLMKTKPDLRITNPYALDDKQFDAAVDLLKQQSAEHRRVLVGLHQGESRPSRAATRWSARPGRSSPTCSTPTRSPVETILPKEGATGWSDTWMISSKAKHPNCMYMWMN